MMIVAKEVSSVQSWGNSTALHDLFSDYKGGSFQASMNRQRCSDEIKTFIYVIAEAYLFEKSVFVV